ncbi:hypothetical protein B1R32_106150 [Abditibacterium utsteinense]|uniref:Tetratricopeptide repeat-containing protein n=1 Tax=Abditibacterium utsteinense TaxID=1960156 RepID=A0A2S8SU16_9BACT|nr:hypothetical protein [Abditibacterium utsteinense]PQV64304.1 hypothetical protein B1R32_106150 [Abditibacterium utsteinense]
MRFLPLFAFLLLVKTVVAAPLSAFEGTLSQTQNGVTTRAKLAWQPPDTLTIETLPDAATGTPAQTTVARGDQTVFFSPATKRARRYNFNIAKNWWRGANLTSGGPANFLFAGTSFPIPSEEGRFLRRDSVVFGGGGKDAYYAAVKTPARRFAAQIVVSPSSRIEKNVSGATISQSQITLDGAGLPRTATLSSAGETAVFTYDLKTTTTPLIVPEIAASILEDDELKAPSVYGANDASALFNRGAALAQNEDYIGAKAAFEAAARLAPEASAPPSALFDLALARRNPQSAQNALANLEKIGLGAGEIEVRRAQLSLLRYDNAGALAAFKAASLAAPQNLSLRLAQAEVARGMGDFDAARALYSGILSEKTSQFNAQAIAAQNLALFATFEEIPALLAALPGQTDAQKLARALLQLRVAQDTGVLDFSRPEFRVALALGFERAAHDDDAQEIWQALEAPTPDKFVNNEAFKAFEIRRNRASDAIKNRARAHLMTLFARHGDVSNSISQWRAWNASLELQPEKERARDAFFGAWQKAFRSDALTGALANRASATGATDDDLRLFLSYQELYGSAEDVTAAIETGATRFPKVAFWKGKRAENLVATANQVHGNQAATARREQLYDQALALLDSAIETAPDQPFFRYQKALAATQRATKTGAIIDASIATRNRARAQKETEHLLADFPGDPDALVSAALQNLSLESDAGAREAIRLANLALDSAPGDGNRHTLIWAAHQALSSAYRRLDQPDLAAAQWEILLLGARDAGEQSTLASGYFALIDSAGEANPNGAAQSAARLLSQLSTENWGYSASRALLESVASRMATSPRAGAISAALFASPEEGAALAAATLASRRIEVARRALEVPEAPPAADANLERATRDLGIALDKLRPVAQSPNRILAARAAAFLAENAGLEGADHLALLQSALEVEPRDAALRFALIGALDAPAAQKELAIAAKMLDFEPETRRQLSTAARRAGDLPGANQIAEEALAFTARAPEYGGGEFQRVAFASGKAAFAAGQISRALEIYNGLSLPQWNDIDRAAALLALSRNYKEAGRDVDANPINLKIPALGLSQSEIETAIGFVDEVEN